MQFIRVKKKPSLNFFYKITKKKLVELVKEVPKLFYIHGQEKIGNDDEATVEGTHLSDLGMMRTAQYLRPYIEKILSS